MLACFVCVGERVHVPVCVWVCARLKSSIYLYNKQSVRRKC